MSVCNSRGMLYIREATLFCFVALNSQSSCLSFTRVGITGVHGSNFAHWARGRHGCAKKRRWALRTGSAGMLGVVFTVRAVDDSDSGTVSWLSSEPGNPGLLALALAVSTQGESCVVGKNIVTHM